MRDRPDRTVASMRKLAKAEALMSRAAQARRPTSAMAAFTDASSVAEQIVEGLAGPRPK